MFGLKGKMLLLFTIAALFVIGIGFYSYHSLLSMEKKVEESMYPSPGIFYLKGISINLNKLYNIFLSDAYSEQEVEADSLLNIIITQLDSLKIIAIDSADKQHIQMIDTIPVLLAKVSADYKALEKRKQIYEEEYYDFIEQEILRSVSELALSQEESVTILQKITSEINNVQLEVPKATTPTPDQQEVKKRNFFQRIFGNKEIAQEETSDPILKKPNVVIKSDTTYRREYDTLSNATKSDLQEEQYIQGMMENLQVRQLQIANELGARTSTIYLQNVMINQEIENILNDLLIREINRFQESIQSIKDSTYRQTILGISFILAFIILSIISLYLVLRDINKNIRYQQLLQKNEQLALKESSDKQKFLAMMSHELRTPLTSIIGYAELLDGKDDKVRAIRSASDYLYKMTNEVLDLAKIQADIIEVKPKAVNLTTIFKDIRDNFEPLIQKKGLNAIFVFQNQPLPVITDSYRVHQVIYNLVHNAIKYTESGFIRLQIEAVPHSKNKKEVRIEIEDSGIGISESELPQIFEDYKQAGTHINKLQGTGLGLGIVKNVVKQLGGSIEVQSKEGVGTLFQLNFIFERAKLSELKEENSLQQIPSTVSLDQVSVFAIDDDPLITNLYEKVLSTTGCQFIAQNDPEKALTELLEKDYDLVLFDYRMGKMSGYQLLQQLQAKGRQPKKTLIVTANTMITKEEAEELNAFDAILYKPLKKNELLHAIYNLLGQSAEPISPIPDQPTDLASYNLEALKQFSGDDEATLMELLEIILTENQHSLELLDRAISDQETKACGELIHKMSSRFAQIAVDSKMDERALQHKLLSGDKDALSNAERLYIYWRDVNDQIKREHFEV